MNTGIPSEANKIANQKKVPVANSATGIQRNTGLENKCDATHAKQNPSIKQPARMPLTSKEERSQVHRDANTLVFVPQQFSPTPVFAPGQYLTYSQYPSQFDMSSQFQSIQKENAEIQNQQVHLLKRLMLPAPKPPVFEGKILDYPKLESAFDTIIEEDSDPSRKLFYLGQYQTGGAAQKTINGLLGLRTEDSYSRARKMLKGRYGNPYRVYEAYQKKAFRLASLYYRRTATGTQ